MPRGVWKRKPEVLNLQEEITSPKVVETQIHEMAPGSKEKVLPEPSVVVKFRPTMTTDSMVKFLQVCGSLDEVSSVELNMNLKNRKED